MPYLDLRTDVVDFTTYPLEIRIAVEGTAHAWFPDFGIKLGGGQRAVLDLLTPSEMAFFCKHNLVRAMAGALARHSISYMAYEAPVFAASKVCRNAAYVASFRRGRVNEAIAPRVRALLHEQGAMSLQGMDEALGQPKGAIATVCAMAWDGAVALDLDAGSPQDIVVLPCPRRELA